MASEDNNMEKIQCKNPKCNKKFPRKSIRIHLAKACNVACYNSYTDEEHEAFKNSSKKIHNEQMRVVNREAYNEEKKKEMSRKHKETYDKKARKRKYEETKIKAQKKSTPKQRLLDFRHATQHGPIFTCMSCHRDLFKKGVKVLTKKLESKIRKNGMYR